jgi:hypothetical protein
MKILPWVRESSLTHVFDPYGIITQWTGQISMDFWRWQTPRKGSKAVIIYVESYVNRGHNPEVVGVS